MNARHTRYANEFNEVLIWDSKEFIEITKRIEFFGKSPSLNIIIQGEMGSGKSLIAEAINNARPKKLKGPMATIWCEAFSINSSNFDYDCPVPANRLRSRLT